MVLIPTVVLLLGLPLCGVWLTGLPVTRYLEFPPRTSSVTHAPFSWEGFLLVAIILIGTIAPFIWRTLSTNTYAARVRFKRPDALNGRQQFPWWGWVGIGWTALWWIIAWTRFPWAASVQEHTFTPLWLGYILVVNAWAYMRTGRCVMLHDWQDFWILFPASAGFWWMFEYLNRFVENWVYSGAGELTAVEYMVRATVPFSTVLPAVVGTAEVLRSYPRMSAGLDRFAAIPAIDSPWLGWFFLSVSSVGLLGLGIWPNYLFPFVWLGPLFLIISVQIISGQSTILSPLAKGDWRKSWVPALAGLICGLFWELWNWHSLAHWEYAIPFVHRFTIFEMPLLGYAGYLPFGVTCIAVADLVLDRNRPGGARSTALCS
ncbi:hypothetical protein YTPLAS18_34140 [Nitrospira sp.]|nr:hypothetical protein YTPLAS18_34140 [Nitrospira sp.]